MVNSRKIKVHPKFVEIADRYREKFEKEVGFNIPRTQVSKQMAEVFDKMINVNGLPQIDKKGRKIGRKKVKTCTIFWEFKL